MPLAPGDKVDRFVLLARIGQGKHGEVFRADDEKLRRRVALKALRATSTEGRAALVRQAIAASAIVHPNAAQIFEVGIAGEHAFIAMELAGKSLARVAEADETSLPLRVVWLVDAARAIAMAHDRGILHGNVSLENVLVREDGSVKVTDFGLDPTAPAPAPESTKVDVDAATVEMRGAALDVSGDVRAWGKIAHEVLPEMSREVEAVVVRAIEGRFGSMHEAADALATAPQALDGPPPTSRLPIAIAVGLIAVVALTGLFLLRTPGRSRTWPLATDAGVVPARTDTVEPEPASNVPEALALYRAGVQGIRDGADRAAIGNFVRAADLDPQLAAAHMRSVIYWNLADEDSREHMRKATELRALLSPRDRAIRDAFEPWVTVPQDGVEAERRLTAAAAERPDDAEIAYHLCHMREALGHYAEAIPACEAALRVDDTFAGAWRYYGVALALLDRTDDAVTAFQRCLAISPQATSCDMDLYFIHAQRGECSDVLVSARRELAADPANPQAYERLANALYASNAPIESVRAAFDQEIRNTPSSERRELQLQTESRLAIATGRFDEARAKLDTLERALRLVSQEGRHVDELNLRFPVDRELQRNDDLARAAKQYLGERAGWTPDSAGGDPTIGAYDALYLAGRMPRADFVRERDAWIARERTATARGGLWGTPLAREWWLAYAHPAREPADADEAIAVLPQHLPMLAAIVQRTPYMLDVGDAFELAHRPTEAIEWLRRATHACWSLAFPVESVRAHAHLARHLEAAGARDEACTEYAWVLARWPVSTKATSAVEAAAGKQRLGCGN